MLRIKPNKPTDKKVSLRTLLHDLYIVYWVRLLFLIFSSTGGAWLVAQRAEQKRHFQAVLSVKPKTYAQIKAERRQKEKAEALKKAAAAAAKESHGVQPPPGSAGTAVTAVVEGSVTEGLLDGFFLVRSFVSYCSTSILNPRYCDVVVYTLN